jgi:hypothetical protein
VPPFVRATWIVRSVLAPGCGDIGSAVTVTVVGRPPL